MMVHNTYFRHQRYETSEKQKFENKIFTVSLLGQLCSEPLNSHESPRLNFSLHYQYKIMQTSDENKEKYY